MTRAHALVVLSYLLAVLAAWFCLPFLSGYHLMLQVLVMDIVATIVVFAFSVIFRNSSFYDPYWSVAPMVIVLFLALQPGSAELWRQGLLGLIILLWGTRLTANWLYTWHGLRHQDWRYVNLASRSGLFWWPLSFVGVHMMPTLIVFAGCLPMYAALVVGERPLNWLDGLALLIGLISVWLEYQADRELHQFRANRSGPHEVLDTGLWGWCRHPNYLGEIGVWVSVCLFGYASIEDPNHWMLAGPLSMLVLFAVVSIPMIENKLIEDKPGYQRYRAGTFALIPIPRRPN